MNVILTSSEDFFSLYFVNSLCRKGIKTIALSNSITSPIFFSLFSTNAYVSPDSGYRNNNLIKNKINHFVKYLNFISKKHHPAMIIPLNEDTLLPISLNRKKINAHTLLPSHEAVLTAVDKINTVRFCMRNSIKMPKTYFLNKDALGRMNKKNFPLVVRPSFSFGDSVSTICTNTQMLINTYNKLLKEGTTPLVQEFLYGANFSTICIFNEKSKPISTFTSSFTPLRRSAIYKPEIRTKKIEKVSIKILKKLKWIGIASLQFIVNDGKIHLIEINPRVGASFVSAMKCGIDIPYILYKTMIGEKAKIKSNCDEKTFINYLDILPVIEKIGFAKFLRELFHGRIRPRIFLTSDPVANLVCQLQVLKGFFDSSARDYQRFSLLRDRLA